MAIAEGSKRYGISPDILRWQGRIGLLPPIEQNLAEKQRGREK